MQRTLIIAEKPSVAADIARVVGAGKKGATGYESDTHVVSWAVGHLLEFVPPEEYDEAFKRWRLKDLPIMPGEFRLKPTKGASKQLAALKKYLKAKDVGVVVNACDAGREGELIFREIYRHAGTDKPVQRLWLQSMTAEAIRASLANPKPLTDVEGLADAADCRAESDWLIGMNATRALTVRLRSTRDRVVWSAGRVQTATLALVVRREQEILAHRPEPYWLLHGTFDAGDHEYDATVVLPDQEGPRDRVTDPAQRDAIAAILARRPPARAAETRKDARESAPPLFDLTTLQREANRRLGYSARRTLSIAQGLYEAHKLITYPRTDSKALPSDYRAPVEAAIRFLAGRPAYADAARALLRDGLENAERNFDDAQVTDHFAIIPTGEGDEGALQDEDRKVFDLIARRFLAAFHPPAIATQVERLTEVEGITLRSRRTVLRVPGWRSVWDKKAAEDEGLPPLADPAGTSVRLALHRVEEKETNPPARHTEASLLALMESAGKEVDDAALSAVLRETGGLGTPATRAETIETLLSRAYIERVTTLQNRKALRATARGIRLVDALLRIPLPKLTSAELTADLEQALREVQEGRRRRAEYMGEVRDWTAEIVERVKGFTYDGLYDDEPPLGACPLCGAPVRETLRTYVCERGGVDGACAFVVWKEVGGRYVDRASAAELVRDRRTSVKPAFFSRDGREYEASLELTEDARVEIRGKSAGEVLAESAERVEPADVGPCPFHAEKGWLVRRGPLGHRCDGVATRACKLSLPLEVCKRKLALPEVAALLGPERKTALIEDFTSKRGRPFAATLHLSDAGRLRFEFPPREAGAGGKGRKEFAVDARPLGACTACGKGEIVESPSDFHCTACKVRVAREICKRPVTRDEAEVLFATGKSALLEGFLSKAGKPFAAYLKTKRPGGHRFEFPEDEA